MNATVIAGLVVFGPLSLFLTTTAPTADVERPAASSAVSESDRPRPGELRERVM